MKQLTWVGPTRDTVRGFPEEIRHDMGFALDQVQRGLPAPDSKPMPTIGKGVHEIRVREGNNHFRAFYAIIGDTVYVLHAFYKNQQQTPKKDVDLGSQRLATARKMAAQ